MSRRDAYRSDPGIEVIRGACPHDCPDTCAWEVAVDRSSGRAIDLWGRREHPFTAGTLCGKVDRYLDRTYHATRLTRPLRRAARGGPLEPVSWERALGDIAARLHAIIDEHGPEAILPYSYGGTLGLLQGEGAASRLFHALGASRLARTICAEAGGWGHRYTTGHALGMDPEDFAHARLILIWGSNTLTSNLHLWPFILAARKRGARAIVIDPANTRTARAADEWIPIRPGTDAALALGIMHVLVTERGPELVDRDYIARYTLGFDSLRARVEAWPPARVEAVTGVPAARVEALARAYATTRPAAIRLNYGLQRHRGGGMAVRAITCLPALTGAWRERGGGLLLSNSGSFRFDRRGLERPDLLGDRAPRTINMSRLADALSLDPAIRARALQRPRPADPAVGPADAGPPVKALIVYNSNPAVVAPDLAGVRRGLARRDLFTVVLEHFMTDTAEHADYVLPATTQLEHWDLHKAYGQLYLTLNQPAIAPVGESLPNSEIFRRLARVLGLQHPCFSQGDEATLREFVAAQHDPALRGITWERLREHGFVRLELPSPYLPFAEGGFHTPSGKCELFSQRMADDGHDPVPDYTPPAYTERRAGPDGSAPLCCISPPAHSFLNSSFVNVTRLRRREQAPRVDIHPEDAAARGIRDGELVRLESDVGHVHLPARVTADVVIGTVLAPGIWWPGDTPDGKGINELTAQGETDMGGGAVFYDLAVWARPAEQRSTSAGAPERA